MATRFFCIVLATVQKPTETVVAAALDNPDWIQDFNCFVDSLLTKQNGQMTRKGSYFQPIEIGIDVSCVFTMVPANTSDGTRSSRRGGSKYPGKNAR